ncbi:hypothetical protein AB5I41_14890 [Sphingomonas sp. MMS24-JH45]
MPKEVEDGVPFQELMLRNLFAEIWSRDAVAHPRSTAHHHRRDRRDRRRDP